MSRESFYDDATYRALVDRVGRLEAGSEPLWGKMSAAQMCAHCAEVAEVAAGKPLEGTSWFVRLISGLIRKMVLSDKPYPRNGKTHPQYVITSPVEFEEQKTRLLAVMEKHKSSGPNEAAEHPLFGGMNAEEQGWAAYKHLDHHLRQFGV